ncbi:DUF5312 domain-containing protein [Desulfomicrobium sp. ZS1]|jgi:hypothetical protein|uniref:DUF5312 domain-containing protein n=1 Tax=Desulfomicrobium sp. ZS1 TaxID=2952228 RepID=UPI0020B43192|nr:DUF5312 domain-containing protein [Desulfomicrobium sp. ZS1]UTF50913.1 DUF5312 domain-containing protein [Desulfomicrobium sp. ZS1]
MAATKQQGCRNGQRKRSHGVSKTLLSNEKIKYFNIRWLRRKLGGLEDWAAWKEFSESMAVCHHNLLFCNFIPNCWWLIWDGLNKID